MKNKTLRCRAPEVSGFIAWIVKAKSNLKTINDLKIFS